jgi:RNase P subunit RPR2
MTLTAKELVDALQGRTRQPKPGETVVVGCYSCGERFRFKLAAKVELPDHLSCPCGEFTNFNVALKLGEKR